MKTIDLKANWKKPSKGHFWHLYFGGKPFGLVSPAIGQTDRWEARVIEGGGSFPHLVGTLEECVGSVERRLEEELRKAIRVRFNNRSRVTRLKGIK